MVQGAGALAAEEERVLDDDAGREVGGVGELPARAHVAGGVDARVGRAQVVVDVDARARVVRDADRLQAEPVDVRRAAGADQDLVDGDARPLAGALVVDHALARRARSTRSITAPVISSHAVAPQRGRHDRRGVGVLAVRISGADLEQRHRAPKRAKACASSQPIGPAPITPSRGGSSVSEKTVSLVR